MSNGIFYAADDSETLYNRYPGAFINDPVSNESHLVSGMVISENGVWLERPVTSPGEDPGAITVVSAGVRSKPFVVLMPAEVTAWEDFRVTPGDSQGYA